MLVLVLLKCLRYPAGMYTCLSGFVDMCEQVEEAFKREAFEEAWTSSFLLGQEEFNSMRNISNL